MDECDNTKTQLPATSEEIFDKLAKNGIWGFPKNARNLKKLKVGDRIIFRRGKFKEGECHKKNAPKHSKTGKKFIATAIVKSEPIPIKEYKKRNSIEMIGYPFTGEMIIELEDLHEFSNPEDLADKLSFCRNKKRWFSYYQGSIIHCPQQDCDKILKSNSKNKYTV